MSWSENDRFSSRFSFRKTKMPSRISLIESSFSSVGPPFSIFVFILFLLMHRLSFSHCAHHGRGRAPSPGSPARPAAEDFVHTPTSHEAANNYVRPLHADNTF